MLGLGSLLDLSLAEAREKAAELRKMLLDGKDPRAERVRKLAEVKAEAASSCTFRSSFGVLHCTSSSAELLPASRLTAAARSDLLEVYTRASNRAREMLT
jgi:hypothetical protein